MAQVFYSLSQCPICNLVLNESDNIIGFPPFVINMNDSLYLFNDSGCHRQCVLDHPFGKKAISLSEKFIAETRPENRVCIVSGLLIENPDNYFFTGLLTSDEYKNIFRYNFITLDKQNIKFWNERNDLLNKLIFFKNKNMWVDMLGSHYLDKLINDLSKVG